jgi:hypothetical protein
MQAVLQWGRVTSSSAAMPGDHAFLVVQFGESLELVGGRMFRRMTFSAWLISWALWSVSAPGLDPGRRSWMPPTPPLQRSGL